MKQIYNFEQYEPPGFTEKNLRTEATHRQLQKQTAMTALASLLVELCLIVGTILLASENPVLAGICTLYIILSIIGGSMISIIFIQKRRHFSL